MNTISTLSTSAGSRLQAVNRFGQQVWLDNLSRGLIDSGELKRLIEDDGIAGVTSNPAIFYQAIRDDPAYHAALKQLRPSYDNPEQLFEALVLPDIQRACDALAPLYLSSKGGAGFVSFEVSPQLANDASGTVAAARRLWNSINRPNLMIKIPATPAGIAALEEVIFDGINVNVTLIFSRRQASLVRAVHRRALELRMTSGLPVAGIASVASVFISRIDTVIDAQLSPEAAGLRGRVATASAKLAYRDWQRDELQFSALKAAGAQPQWLLWASTGNKNPDFRDVRYVEDLIGPDTVNTIPDATLAAFRDHGHAAATLTSEVEQAEVMLGRLAVDNINLDAVCEQLLQAGLVQFDDAFARLMALLA
jgi:transaldolase